MWFERLTGFQEISPQQVRENITLNDGLMTSRANGKSWQYGHLEYPSLQELREHSARLNLPTGKLCLSETVANVQDLHTAPSNENALFQVASQFNLLEMTGPNVTPEQGIGIYDYDKTQGPACAIAAGAGTIYRNYFTALGTQLGQTADCQIDCLNDIGQAIGNENNTLWTMQNGYVLSTQSRLELISRRLQAMTEPELDTLRSRLRIGLHWQTQVTLQDCKHKVSQAYCSALPVAYQNYPPKLWQEFAKLILDAAYEATLHAAMLNFARTQNNKVYLTLLGGGAFGNESTWIIEALGKAVRQFANAPLDISIVSYGKSDPIVQNFILSS